jgi:hypothetical protein
MKKTLLLASLLVGSVFTMNAQTVLFEDNFESHTDFAITGVGDWTLMDIDGSATYGFTGIEFPNAYQPMAFIVMNPSTTTPAATDDETMAAHSGNKYMASFAATTSANNDWMISPQITLGTSDNVVKFWAKSLTVQYGAERFNVLISTTDTNTPSFTKISTGNFTTVQDAWTEFTYNLDAYSGQQVYIAIQCVSDDAFVFMVDDFSVTSASASVDSALAGSFSVYPNPATDVLNISNSINAEINAITITDLNGRTVKQITANGSVDSQINISDLNAGVYFVNINSNEGSLTKKIVKK